MPRKAAPDPDASSAPRRSSRIASQPSDLIKESKPPPPTKKVGGKKRVADDNVDTVTQELQTAKKAKPNDEETDQLKDDNSDDDDDGDPRELEIGDSLPSLTLKDEKGDNIVISELATEQGVILFLVPKADTPGCTRQACGFRDIYSDIQDLGYSVYCVSADGSASQSKWQTKKSLPYSLISDPKRELITALGAGKGGKTARSHFIFEKGGKLVDKKLPVKPDDSPVKALEYIRSQETS